jgi:membrane protein implicated in regulation of membrane protease activity
MPAEAYFWIVLMIALLIVEAVTYGLTCIWFAAGAMAAAICAALMLTMPVQVIAFLLVSVALLALLRPMAKNMLNARRTATNADRVYEKLGVVTEAIDNVNGKGAVYVDGKTWTSRSYSGKPIPAGSHVSVKMIDGVKLIVEPVAAPESPDTREDYEDGQADKSVALESADEREDYEDPFDYIFRIFHSKNRDKRADDQDEPEDP